MVNTNHKPSYYALLYATVREVGLSCGWAVAIHGSLASDLDLIAVAWTEDAKSLPDFLESVTDALSGTVFKYSWNGPHQSESGREIWTLPIEGDHYLDMTVFDGRNRKSDIGQIFRAKRLDTGEMVEGDLVHISTESGNGLGIKDSAYHVNDGMINIIPREVDPATLQQKIGDHWLTPGQVEGLVCCGTCDNCGTDRVYGKSIVCYRDNKQRSLNYTCPHWRAR